MSPIENLTDRGSLRPTYRELGRLRKGRKIQKAREDGSIYEAMEDLTYFRFTSEDKAIEAAFKAAFGDEPRQLRVYLPFETLEENFPTWYEEWTAGGMVHQCDKHWMTLHRLPDGTMSHERKECPYFTGEKTRDKKAKPPRPGCTPIGRLNLIIPELLGVGKAAHETGYITFVTKSKHDCRNISNVLAKTETDARFKGRVLGLKGIEFKLWREEVEISTPSEESHSGRARRRKWLCFIAPAYKWVAVQYQLQQQMALALLESGEEEDEEEDPAGYEEGDDVVTDGEFRADPESAQAQPRPAPSPASDPKPATRVPSPEGKWSAVPASNDGFVIPDGFEPTDEGLRAARAHVITVGKYSGKTMGEIEDNDRGYIAWLTGPKFDGTVNGRAITKRAAVYIRSWRKLEEWKAVQAHLLPEEPTGEPTQAGLGL